MKKVHLFFTALAMLTCVFAAQAKNITVTGIVSDSSTGDPVVGAAVQLKGSTTAYALSDINGAYSISVPADGALVVSCLGYVTVEKPVDGISVINVALSADTQVLEDVVVVAYGSAKREAVTGSVTSVKGDAIASSPVTSVDKALSGKLAGVQITATTGQPGATSQIRIRGNSSINASNSPLWVIDGIPILTGSLSSSNISDAESSVLTTLNPNDIESITVLKDAAAASVYGSRAAAGVILVTTKTGKEGKASFTASAKYGVNWLQTDNDFRVMTGAELLAYQRDAVYNAGLDPDDPTCTYYRPLSMLNAQMTNWLQEFTKLGTIQEYEISARGGSDKAKYYSSVSYHKNDGTFYGVDYEKFQARVNSDYKLSKTLETGARFNLGYTNQNNIPMESLYYENPTWAGLTIYPWIPARDEDGNPNVDIPTNSNSNPLASALTNTDNLKSYHLNATAFLRWTPVKNLVLESKNSAEAIFSKEYSFLSEEVGYDNYVLNNDNQILQLTTSNTANYANVFGGYHNVRFLLGQEAMKYSGYTVYSETSGANPDIPYIDTSDQSNSSVSTGISAKTLLSFFGIADYNYDNKYFLQGSLRADGSSLFGSNNKWGLFWSASASWNVTAEDFMSGVSAVDLLKVRASYGVNGNNGISAYKAYGTYGTASYNGVVGLLPSQPSNEKLSWEKNKAWNVGLDFSVLGRIHGSVDAYNRVTEDMLLSKSVPYTTGFGTNFLNVGSMQNTGIEFQFDADIVSGKDFNWNVGFNLAHNVTEILDLGGDEKIVAASYCHYVVGQSMYSYYLKDYYGVNPADGSALWVTEDGTLTGDYTKARDYYAGSPEPKLMGGFNTTLTYKGFSLSASFEYKTGSYIFLPNESSYLLSDGAEMGMNQLASGTNYWKQPGDTGCNPKPIAGNTTNSAYWRSDRYLQRSDYLRIKDVTLSYTLPKTCVQKIGLAGVRVYASGLNLYCWNDVEYWDPEVGVTGVVTGGIYPLTKSVVGGIEVTF